MVHVKCDFDGQCLRRFHLPNEVEGRSLTIADLTCALESTYPFVDFSSRNLALSFVDDEGDECGLLIDADLHEALQNTPTLLRLKVRDVPVPKPDQCDKALEEDAAMEIVAPTDVPANEMKLRKNKPGLLDFIADYVTEAEESRFPELFTNIDRDALTLAGDANRKVTLRSLRIQMRSFVLKECTLRNVKKNPTISVNEGAVEILVENIERTLAGAELEPEVVSSISNVVKAALADPGVIAAMTRFRLANRQKNQEQKRSKELNSCNEQQQDVLMEKTSTGTDAAMDESTGEARPIDLLIKAAETDEAKKVIFEFREECKRNASDVEKLLNVRKEIRKSTSLFLKENVPIGDAAVSDEAIEKYVDGVKRIFLAAGVSQNIAESGARVASAMARDASVRAQAFEIKNKGRKKSLTMDVHVDPACFPDEMASC